MTAELPAGIRPNGRYNKSQASRILGISRPTLDKYIREGRIATLLWGGTIYIKGLTIIKFFNS